MGHLCLQEPELQEITRSDTTRFPPMSVQVSLTCKARLEHGSSRSGEFESDPSGDRVDHHETCCPNTVDPTYKPSLESNSKGG
jgi:hypothetical protein